MKVIIVSTNTGDGHDAAASALAAAAPADAEVLVWHLEDFLKPWQTFLLVVSYRCVVMNFKDVIWRGLYNFAQTKRGYNWFKWLVYVCPDAIRRFCTAVESTKPDLIITTHFYIPIFLEKMRDPKYTLCEIVTDYGWHRLWFHPSVKKYFVPSPITAAGLKEYTAQSVSITESGIPVKPVFYEPIQKSELRAKLGVPQNKPLILIMTGGTGLVPADRYLRVLIPFTNDWSIIVIAGKNKKLKAELEKIKTEHKLTDVQVTGWTNKPADFIRAADVVVTKPGGLTTSECTAAGRPMILVSPIPGQEEANATYFVSQGQAIEAKTPADLVPALKTILQTPPEKFANKKPPASELIWRELGQN